MKYQLCIKKNDLKLDLIRCVMMKFSFEDIMVFNIVMCLRHVYISLNLSTCLTSLTIKVSA